MKRNRLGKGISDLPARFGVSRSGRVLVALLLSMLGFATSSRGEVAEIDVLFDLDRNPSTGCSVISVDGQVDGIELRVRTSFDVGLESVLSTLTADCVDPFLGLFGADSPVTTDPQPVWSGIAGNGAAGSMLIESHFPSAIAGSAATARAYVVASSLVGEDALLVGPGGAPLLVSVSAPSVPALGVVAAGGLLAGLILLVRGEQRGRFVACGLLGILAGVAILFPARSWALLGEGLHRIWTLEERVGVDPEADAPAGIDLLELHASYDGATQEVWLRADILFGAPVCSDWGIVDPGAGYACGMQPPLDSGPFGGAVAMTFDDGPHLTVTPQVLATLRAHGIPATFFVVGNRLQTAAEQALVLEIHQDPLFRVANHSLTHRRMNQIPPEEVEPEVKENNDLIREAIGDPCYFPRYFRFPYAASNCLSMEASRTHGLASAAVHINTSDWCYGQNNGTCPAEWVPFIEDEFRDDLPGWAVNRFQASGGGILVMHDIHTNTAAQLPAVIAGLQAAGATFVDLSDPVLFPIMNATINPPEAPACCEGVVN